MEIESFFRYRSFIVDKQDRDMTHDESRPRSVTYNSVNGNLVGNEYAQHRRDPIEHEQTSRLIVSFMDRHVVVYTYDNATMIDERALPVFIFLACVSF
jgi:hypothetical protein